MNKFYYFFKKSFLLFLPFVLVVSTYAQFQSTPVSKSEQKIIFQGNLYYMHTVKEGQTLHSICATYGVTIDDLRTTNVNVVLEPLSINQVLKIPVEEIPGKLAISPNQPGEQDFFYHTVQAKETPYFLHKKYNVSLETIYKFNPGSEKGLQIAQVIRIPRGQVLEDDKILISKNNQDKTYYEVKQGDTLYRIAQDYQVSISAIIYENESLRYGLKVGMIISIPGSRVAYRPLLNGADSVMLVTSSFGLSSFQCDSIQKLRSQHPPVKVALLLPFFLKENKIAESFNIPADSMSTAQRTIVGNAQKGMGAVEFYEGILLAVDSLKKTGIDMSLFVYDTEGDSNTIKSILGELEIVEPNIIIGPFLDNNVKLVSKFSFEYKIPFVPPILSNNSEIIQNPYQYQIAPGAMLENQQYARYLSQYFDKNLLLIYKRELKTTEQIQSFKQVLLNHLSLKPGFDTLNFTEVLINDSLHYSLSSSLSDSLENYAIIFSPFEPDVINVITHLHFASRELDVKIFGLPEWQVFKDFKVDQIHDLETVLYSPFFIDYKSERVKNFVSKSRNKLGFEPYKTSPKGSGLNYTYLGYDLGFLFIKSTYLYGSNTCDCAEQFSPQMLLSQYHFTKNSNTGYLENTTINIVEYSKEYEIIYKGIVGE